MSATPVKVPTPATVKGSRFNWARTFGYDFFVSFKLGAPPIGAQSYASDLARRLRELEFTVFFSEEEAPPGENLDRTLVTALHRSRILVVVVNEGALMKSQWVRKEVEEFRRKHPNRPVIPINVDGAIDRFGPQAEAAKWLDYSGRIWLDETRQALQEGIVSAEVIQRLGVSYRFLRAKTWRNGSVGAIMLLLSGLAAYAAYQARLAIQGKQAIQRRLADTDYTEARNWLAKGRKHTSLAFLADSVTKDSAFLPGRGMRSDLLLRGDWSLPRAARQLGDRVISAQFSPDGRQVVTITEDNTARVWDSQLLAAVRNRGKLATDALNLVGTTKGLNGPLRFWTGVTRFRTAARCQRVA